MKCKDCKYRKEWEIFGALKMICMSDKLQEEFGQDDSARDDMLIYAYQEGGYFEVGANFGCIHFDGGEV